MNSRNRGRAVRELAARGDATPGQHKVAQATESQPGGDDRPGQVEPDGHEQPQSGQDCAGVGGGG